MSFFKSGFLILIIVCIIVTILGVIILGGINQDDLQTWLGNMGILAPIIYIIFYTLATLLILPSTPFNLTGGAIFGIWYGTLWTTLAAIIAAIISFIFTRTIGRNLVTKKLKGHWEAIDAEIYYGGLFYLFAIRLLPLIPYGIVNFASGLTSIKFKDYLIGTILGTLPGVFPFVMMGAGINQLSQGSVFPLMFAFALIGMLVGSATWYTRHRRPLVNKLRKSEEKPEK